MYDKNRIEDSLEFVRQMKEFMDSDDALDEFDPFEDNDPDELFVNLAYHMEPEVPPKESAVQASHAMGDSFGVPDAGVLQEQRRLAEERLRLEQEAAKRKQAELEQQRRLEEERRRLEAEAAKRRQAELEEKQRQEAERKKIEEERKRLAEEQKRQEEARRQWEEERRKAQEEAKRREAELAEKKRLEEEKQRQAQEEARRKEAELAEKKRLEEEKQRLAQEEARRKQAELAEKKRLEEERKCLAQEAERRRQAELQEKQRQEAERQKIEEERRRLAEEQKRQEQARRQLEKERQRLVEEQLQRELEEQRRILAEQARKKAEEKAKKEAAEKERRRKLLQEEQQRKKELQAREEEQRRKAQEEAKKQEEQRLAQEEAKKREEQHPSVAEMPKPSIAMPDQGKTAADDPESEVERLRKRAEELKRQAEMATLEARMRQLQLEAEGISTGESVIVPPTAANANAVNGSVSAVNSGTASGTTAAGGSNSIPMPMLSIPGVQAGAMASGAGQQTASNQQNADNKQKLSKEEIDSIFAKELKKSSSDSSYQQRKVMLQKQAERLKRKREETGDKLPLELAKEKAAQAKDFTLGTFWKVREFILDKMTDPENAESREKIKKIMTNVLVVMICIAIAFLVSSIVTNFVAHPTKVEGESMETTLTDGDTVIIQKLSYYFGTPDRYDVVVFPIYNSKTYFIKRVIGLPGETVQIEEGKVYINGKELEDDVYGKDEYIDDPGDAGEPITLASDEYFVLGDNRNMSTDSRSSYVGVIKKKNIAGKAWRRVLPFSKNGKVK